jgi:hypothetical protein
MISMDRTAKLLKAHVRHRGLFARIAKKLNIDPSYVSRVVRGQRRSKRISAAIKAELDKIYRSGRKGLRKRS